MATFSFELHTEAVAPHRRRHAARDFLDSLGVAMECTPLDPDHWSIASRVRVLHSGHLSRSHTSPMRTTVAAPSEHIIIAAMSEAFQIEQPGQRDLWATAGDLYLGRFPNRARLTLGRPYETHAFTFARDALTPLVKDADTAIKILPTATPAATLLAGYLRLATNQILLPGAEPPQEMEAAVANHIRDLTALALGARADAQEMIRDGGVRAARLAAIHAHMARHFHEPDLSADRTAAALGITPRYVRRLLDEAGDSFSGRLADLRLEAAMRSLVSPLEAHRTIAEIAYCVGYAEFTTFFRHFRRRYGLSPSEARAKG